MYLAKRLETQTVPASLMPGGLRAWRVWAMAAAVYMVSVFHRSSLSVAGLAAAERFHVGAMELSTFTVLQILVYALMQVPVGLLLDRHGSRRLLTIGLLLMSVAQIGFAFVESYPLALLLRGLLGIGDAMTFLSVMRLVALWFPARRNPLLGQFTSLAGQAGAMLAAVPMAHVLLAHGWTVAYLGGAAGGLLVGVLMYRFVIDSPVPIVDGSGSEHGLGQRLATLGRCWERPGTRLGVWVYFVTLFAPNTLLLLWGYPWLVEGQGLSATAAAGLLSLMPLSAMAGGPVLGWLIGRKPHWRLRVLSVLMGTTVVLWSAVLAWPGSAPTWLLAGLLLLVGNGFSSAMIGFDVARLYNPVSSVGTAMALVNVSGYLSTIVVVLGIGLVLDLLTPAGAAQHAPDSFRLAMLVPYPVWAFGLVGILRCRRQLRGRELPVPAGTATDDRLPVSAAAP